MEIKGGLGYLVSLNRTLFIIYILVKPSFFFLRRESWYDQLHNFCKIWIRLVYKTSKKEPH